ncbi:MAG: ATP-binding protein [Pseudomonadota bacterium]
MPHGPETGLADDAPAAEAGAARAAARETAAPAARTTAAAAAAGIARALSALDRARRWASLAWRRLGLLTPVRRLLPRSLLWRGFLIVAAPVLVLQGVVASLVIERHFDGVTRQMTEGVSHEIGHLAALVDEAPSLAAAQRRLGPSADALGFQIDLAVGATIPPTLQPQFFDVIGRAVEETLRERLEARLFVAFPTERKVVDIRVQTRFGVLRVQAPRRRLIASNPHLLLVWSSLAATAVIVVALLYLRNQVRPIRALAEAAKAFGRGRAEPLRIAGAQEVRAAAAAFLDMRGRIERHIEQRTRMLSGVSHDMRTPLTRMKLALEMMGDAKEIDALRHDVRDLEHILDEFLAYARGDHGEAVEPTDVLELVRGVVRDARRKSGEVALEERVEDADPEAARLNIRPLAMKRCLHNLIENGLAYGERVAVAVVVGARQIEVIVEDDGPGIPAEERAAAFRPFHRLDSARNQDKTGGVGLGLALALDAVRGHGGDLLLEDSVRLGGLKAVARLPR